MREYVDKNGLYHYFYRLVGDIEKEELKLGGSLLEFAKREDEKTLKVKYKAYKAKTELGEIFLVDALVSVFEDEQMYDNNNYAFFSEKEARKFIDETFGNKITQEVFEC